MDEKLNVFICWSGDASRGVAAKLNEWLETALRGVRTFMSDDIEKGRRWNAEIAKNLEASSFGIICLTPENLDSTWIHFEAGALSKLSKANVCTLLLAGLEPSSVRQPLGDFQATSASEDDLRRLFADLHKLLPQPYQLSDPAKLEDLFMFFWEKVEPALKAAGKANATGKVKLDQDTILEEILLAVRENGGRPDLEKLFRRIDDRLDRIQLPIQVLLDSFQARRFNPLPNEGSWPHTFGEDSLEAREVDRIATRFRRVAEQLKVDAVLDTVGVKGNRVTIQWRAAGGVQRGVVVPIRLPSEQLDRRLRRALSYAELDFEIADDLLGDDADLDRQA